LDDASVVKLHDTSGDRIPASGDRGPAGGDAGGAAAPAVDAAGSNDAAGVDDAGSLSPSQAPADMALVPGGPFTMGSDTGGQEDERPAHTVTLAPFYLDKVEVTHEAYGECVAQRVCRPPDAKVISRFGGVFVQPRKPVTGISWSDAKAYCAFRGKRLPREAEFERAVRGDDGRRYPWGAEAPTKELTVFHTSTTEEVGTHPKGRGPFGHDDLAGNVWEWMEDEYDPIAYRRSTAPQGQPGTCAEIKETLEKLHREGRQGFTGSNPLPTECERSIRGGAYNYDAYGLRSTNRVHHPGNYRLLMTGVRCAKSAR
jgi:formylglycine-generating enzyme required for sulfatase activity